MENLPPIVRSPRVSPTPRSIKSFHVNQFSSPRQSKTKQQTPRISPIRETPRKINSQNQTESKHVNLKDILAGNRARRGPRIPKPRREVDDQKLYDLPTYRKNYIKNGFLVHK